MPQKIFRTIVIIALLSLIVISATGCVKLKKSAQLDLSKLVIKKASVNDIDVAYKETGEGYPLILIMGFSGTMDLWSPELIAGLAQNNRVIVFDNRGIGSTSSSDQKFSIRLFADDTAGLLEALKIEKANVLGWSMGTHIAQELVLNYPDKVNKLILYAADAGGTEAVFNSDVIAQLNDTSGTDMERGERLLKLIFPEGWLKENPDPRKYMQTSTEQVSPESIKKQGVACGAWIGTFSRLSQINAPVLFIAGTDDMVTPPQNSVMMAGKIPSSWLVQIKDGGHGLMFQYPDKFVKISNLFLSLDE